MHRQNLLWMNLCYKIILQRHNIIVIHEAEFHEGEDDIGYFFVYVVALGSPLFHS